ncbi:hypothetical protein [Rhizobium ruizarguesonis]|uniref:hypothetical protein n=1 Tax=Rhizobium ruizarguesonis TaxID=2081791 RepID=UPI00103182A7|nr:hypothetical protein [Rhizobium ruizarguesonis]TAT70055.1 hypothetical protein ELI52_38170 [Rhizobium ruizarguesonis]
MRYWDALEATVTAAEAIAECQRHDIKASVRESDGALIEEDTGEVIAAADDEGEFSGEAVIGFLGY